MSKIVRLVALAVMVQFVTWSEIHAQLFNLKGWVVEAGPGSKGLPVAGAVVYTLRGESTNSDSTGQFLLTVSSSMPLMVFTSMTGYQTDSLLVRDTSQIVMHLSRVKDLKEVEIQARQSGVKYSTMKSINVETITEKEIMKAACCNLSEAFETSPTINVAYSDAVTGAKEIRLLGLSGIYAQLLTEGIPNYRGIAGAYGLYFIPGPWMESIQLTKGSGSVQQGYEATTGQINVEFKKPFEEKVPRFFINLFGEQNGNMEINLLGKKVLNNRWSSVLMAHGNYMEGMQDLQHDGFLDIPHARQVNLYNRWQYSSHDRVESQIGCRFVVDEKQGGQYSKIASMNDRLYTTQVNNKRAEVFGKFGVLYPDKPGKSIGNIAQITVHQLDSRFGIITYDANERTVYLQSIYQNRIDCDQEYKLGLNYRYDRWEERKDSLTRSTTESVPGVFGEYTINHANKWSIVAGMRLDYHNLYSWIYTPRLHVRYNFSPMVVVRLSAGNSFRVPNIFADNIGVLASSRTIVLDPSIRPERAWNFGFNVTGKFNMAGREGAVNLDVYHTSFTNQLVVDRVTAIDKVYFYNLNGRSFSTSGQVSVDYEFLENLDVRIAYKKDDVKITYNDILQRKPLVPSDRILFNMGYRTPNEHWRFDYTLVREGSKRLLPVYPDPLINGVLQQSPSYFTMNLQLTKVFRKFEVYTGAENLLNYYQQHPIVNANDPFGNSFDASNVWGPIDGRRIYIGLRMGIK